MLPHLRATPTSVPLCTSCKTTLLWQRARRASGLCKPCSSPSLALPAQPHSSTLPPLSLAEFEHDLADADTLPAAPLLWELGVREGEVFSLLTELLELRDSEEMPGDPEPWEAEARALRDVWQASSDAAHLLCDLPLPTPRSIARALFSSLPATSEDLYLDPVGLSVIPLAALPDSVLAAASVEVAPPQPGQAFWHSPDVWRSSHLDAPEEALSSWDIPLITARGEVRGILYVAPEEFSDEEASAYERLRRSGLGRVRSLLALRP